MNRIVSQNQRRFLSFVMAMSMCLSVSACKHSSNGKIGEVEKALEEKCNAKEVSEEEVYEEMVDTKYDIRDTQNDFKDGLYTAVLPEDFDFFGYHTVTDSRNVKSVFKYIKTDPSCSSKDVVSEMEVLVIQFKDHDAASKYFEAIQSQREKNYESNKQMKLDFFNEFVSKKEYFAYASKTDDMLFNVYAQIDGSTVLYAFVEGPISAKLENDYIAFMKEMEYSIISTQ